MPTISFSRRARAGAAPGRRPSGHHLLDRVVALQKRDSSVMTSATSASCATMPSATPRTVMSRSVTMPASARPSVTGSAPTSISLHAAGGRLQGLVAADGGDAAGHDVGDGVMAVTRSEGNEKDDRRRGDEHEEQGGRRSGVVGSKHENDHDRLQAAGVDADRCRRLRQG